MPRQYGPFDPATCGQNAKRILEVATLDQKAAAQRAADQEVDAYSETLRKASEGVGSFGGPHTSRRRGAAVTPHVTQTTRVQIRMQSSREADKVAPTASHVVPPL